MPIHLSTLSRFLVSSPNWQLTSTRRRPVQRSGLASNGSFWGPVWIETFEMAFGAGATTCGRYIPVRRTIETLTRLAESSIIKELGGLYLRSLIRCHKCSSNSVNSRPRDGHSTRTAGATRPVIDQVRTVISRHNPDGGAGPAAETAARLKHQILRLRTKPIQESHIADASRRLA